MDPAVTGLGIIKWCQDFMTNPASRAHQIAASNLFFQAVAQTHTSAHASVTAQLPAHASATAKLQAQAHDSAPASALSFPFLWIPPGLQSPPTKKAMF